MCMNRVIVAGSRYYNDKEALYNMVDTVLKSIDGDVEIISGNCRGADKLGEQYAEEHGIPVKIFPAEWLKYGKRAGYIRNKQMAEYASEENGVLIAFPFGDSKGTNMMIKLGKEHGLKVFVVKDDLYSWG